jgi:tetratricopeptide (TPR) repeat protein
VDVVVIEAGVIAGYVVAWVVRKARRVARRLDAEVDGAIDEGLDHLHEAVAAKPGGHRALTDLAGEAQAAAAKGSEVGARIRQQVELAVAEAAREDESFGQAVTDLLARLREAEHATGKQVTADGGLAVFTGDAYAEARDGGIAIGQVGRDVIIGRVPPDPPGPAAQPLTAPGNSRGKSLDARLPSPKADARHCGATPVRPGRPGSLVFNAGSSIGHAEQVTINQVSPSQPGGDEWRRRAADVQIADPEKSVAWLLHPASAVVPFFGRAEQMEWLRQWCDDDNSAPVRLLAAPGGYGKTRLAREFTASSEQVGWQVLQIAPGDEALEHATALIADDNAGPRLLVMVDYAETRKPQEMARLVAATARGNRRRNTRLLLVARHAGSWWETLFFYHPQDTALIKSITIPANVIDLPARSDDRPQQAVIADAAAAFAARLGCSVPDRLPEADPDPEAPLLRLHARALVTVLGSPIASGHDVLDEVLQHESRYWLSRARRSRPPLVADVDPEQVNEAITPLRQLAGMAALLGARDERETTGLVTRAVPGSDPDATRQWSAWLADLYPAGPENSIGTLQPDLLAEHLVAQLLKASDEEQLQRTFTNLSHDQAVQALTVVGRAVDQHPELPSLIPAILTADLSVMTGAVISLALQFPGRYTGALVQALPGALDLLQLRDLMGRIKYPSLELSRVAAALTGAIIDQMGTGSSTATRAAWYVQAALWSATVGRRAETLTYCQQAAALYRSLSRKDRDINGLIASVLDEANQVANGGRWSEVIHNFEGAVALAVQQDPELPAVNRDAYLRSVLDPRVMNVRTVGVKGGGPHGDEALPSSEKLVALYRRLAEDNPDAYLPDLADSVQSHAMHLAEAERWQEGVTYSEQAISLYRRLFEDGRDAYLSDLAQSVHSHAMHLAGDGRWQEAVICSQEAVALGRKMARASSGVPGAERSIVGALLNHHNRLSEVGRWREALSYSEEAVGLYRTLAEHNPSAYLASLAVVVVNHALVAVVAGRQSEAHTYSEEAVRLHRRLAGSNRGDNQPVLTHSVHSHALRLVAAGRRSEALAYSDGAIRLYLALAEANREEYLPYLARGLWQAAQVRHRLGVELEHALSLIDTSVRMYPTLARRKPQAVLYDLQSVTGMYGDILANNPQLSVNAHRVEETLAICSRVFDEIRRRLDSP